MGGGNLLYIYTHKPGDTKFVVSHQICYTGGTFDITYSVTLSLLCHIFDVQWNISL